MHRKQLFNTTAQTQLDFAIGVGIFFVAFGIVLAGTTPLLTPFTTGQENIAASDRIADKTTNTLLTTGNEQYTLDRDCTTTFFESMRNSPQTPPDDCRYDEFDSDENLNDVFGVDQTYYVNITIEDTNGNIVTMDGTTLAAGTIPDTGTVTLSQRAIRIGGQMYYAYIRVTR